MTLSQPTSATEPDPAEQPPTIGLNTTRPPWNLLPPTNLEIYSRLYVIETALRELIIETLSDKDGPLWYKTRLPSDILDKYRDARRKELSFHWTQMTPHHPLYYLDFPDLRKIIEQKNNWRDAFQLIFARQDFLSATLAELETPRNKIAHHRRATNTDTNIVIAAYDKLSTLLGQSRFLALAARCTQAADIESLLLDYRNSLDQLHAQISAAATITLPETIRSLEDAWWFDDTYLGNPVNALSDLFSTLREYASIPRTRGDGYRVTAWVRSADLDRKHRAALDQLATILTLR